MSGESISFVGRNIEIKQLNMKQIREFIADLDPTADPHVMDLVFDDPVPAKAVSLSTGLSLDELAGAITQEEARGLLDKVKAVNPSFVGMMERIIKAGQQLNES